MKNKDYISYEILKSKVCVDVEQFWFLKHPGWNTLKIADFSLTNTFFKNVLELNKKLYSFHAVI